MIEQQQNAPPRTYTAQQIADAVHIDVTEVYRMGDEIPGRFRLGKRTRWVASAVDPWIAAGCPRKAA